MPRFDFLCHKYGVKSKESLSHFGQIERNAASFLRSIEGTNTSVIITADHGLIDVPWRKIIDISKHPKLKETLTLPLCGEPRAAYCYVHPLKVKQFEGYMRKHFTKKCTVHKSEDLIKNNYFGLFKPNKNLFDRVGDYVIIMKDNYAIRDRILGEKEEKHIGRHGGISKEEMYVPLIFAKK